MKSFDGESDGGGNEYLDVDVFESVDGLDTAGAALVDLVRAILREMCEPR